MRVATVSTAHAPRAFWQEPIVNRIAPPYYSERPKLVVFGGGKGGVGRSTLCAEIARSLARQSAHRILCLDASWSCPTLNTFLNAPPPLMPMADEHGALPSMDDEDAHIAEFICETANKHIYLASLAAARAYPFTRPNLHARTLIDQLHQLDFTTILIDLGPELDPFNIGLFTLSDIPLIICSPEPAAVSMSTQFLRAVITQSLTMRAHLAQDQDAVLDFIYNLPIDFNLATLQHMAGHHQGLQHLISSTLQSLETYLIINLVREGAERDMGFVLSHAWFKELGTFPRFLTPVDYEDRRWFYNRRHAGLSNSRGDEALSHDIEQVVRAISQIEVTDQKYPRPIPEHHEQLSAAVQLGLHPDTNVNLIRQHCRRIWEGYRRETTVSLAFQNPDDRTHMADAIEHLYRRAIPLPGEPGAAPPTPPPPPQHAPAPHTTPPTKAQPPADSPPALPEGSFHVKKDALPGQLIERLRRQHKMSLQELSQRTHIGLKYLTAIEDADFEVLPRSVYLRGYLREIARIFLVDPDELVTEYFRLLDAQQP